MCQIALEGTLIRRIMVTAGVSSYGVPYLDTVGRILGGYLVQGARRVGGPPGHLRAGIQGWYRPG